MQVCTQPNREAGIFRLYSDADGSPSFGISSRIFSATGWSSRKEIPIICTAQLCERKSGIRIVMGLWGEERNCKVLGFHGRRMQSRASWEERSPGMSCSWFYLTLTLQKGDGGGGCRCCEIFPKKLKKNKSETHDGITNSVKLVPTGSCLKLMILVLAPFQLLSPLSRPISPSVSCDGCYT